MNLKGLQGCLSVNARHVILIVLFCTLGQVCLGHIGDWVAPQG